MKINMDDIQEELNLLAKRHFNSPEHNAAVIAVDAINLINEYYQNDLSEDDIRLFMNAFIALINGAPLSPIEEDDEFVPFHDTAVSAKRYPPLIGRGDGFYVDTMRFTYINVYSNKSLSDSESITSFADYVLHEKSPISLPYMPGQDNHICYIEAFSCHGVEYCDTFGILYVSKDAHEPKNEQDAISILRFFKRGSKDGNWEEITRTEYAFRHNRADSKDEKKENQNG